MYELRFVFFLIGVRFCLVSFILEVISFGVYIFMSSGVMFFVMEYELEDVFGFLLCYIFWSKKREKWKKFIVLKVVVSFMDEEYGWFKINKLVLLGLVDFFK